MERCKYVVLVCLHEEEIVRRWSSWEEMDAKKKWMKKMKDREEE